MAELTADTIKPMENVEIDYFAFQIANGVQLYVGQYVDLASGYANVHTPASSAVLAGIVVGAGVPGNDPNLDPIVSGDSIAPGNTSATPPPTVVVNRGAHTLVGVSAITGAAGAESDVGTVVYLTNGNDWSTSATNSDKASGRISGYNSTSATWEITVPAVASRNGGV